MAMAMAIDDALDLDLSGYSATSSTPDNDGGCNWSDWSPVVDWDAISGGHDDFHGLLESMMDEDGELELELSPFLQGGACNSASSTGDTSRSADYEETNGGEDSKGLRLVHLLMAAAEALTGANKSRDLARVILVRLKELVSPTDGSNMERLAAYFTDALQGLLEGAGGAHANNNNHNKKQCFITTNNSGPHHNEHSHPTDVIAAFQLLQDMSPYVKFCHFTANQAILEAVIQDRRIHIVDYDIMEGIQWASLMQALVSRKDGPPTPHLRITALSHSRRSIHTVQETGRRLVAFAASIGQPFSFHQCRLDSDDSFRPSAVKLVRGEALIVNCMLNLPHFGYRPPDSVASFLSGSKALNPRLITLVEEEVGPTGDGGFVERFMDALHQYSALYDSLESGFPMLDRSRALVERVFLGPRISGSLARIYLAHGGDEEMFSWGEWLSADGFGRVPISYANQCQAKLLLGLFNDGYRVEEVASNRLVLGWKSRRLLSASVWTMSLSSDSSPSV